MVAKSKGNVGRFFRSVIAELKKVSWPNRRETTTYTIVVIITVLILGVLIGAFDGILGFLTTRL